MEQDNAPMPVDKRLAAYRRARHLAKALDPGGFNEHIRAVLNEAAKAGEQAERLLRQGA